MLKDAKSASILQQCKQWGLGMIVFKIMVEAGIQEATYN
jgi:hypothetical protein